MEEEKTVTFKSSDFKHKFTEESSYVTYFPAYRKEYIDKTAKYIVNVLVSHKLSIDIDFEELKITIKTNDKTRDPFIFVKGSDFVKLICRGVEVERAAKILEDDVFCDIIKISNLVKKKEVFEKRRDRLVGPSGATLKALKLLTGCYILVSGKTVCAIGTYDGVCTVRDVAIKCMENVHPVYEIKFLMDKKKLSENSDMKEENWERLLPKIKKINQKHSKKVKSRKTGGMPSEPLKRKIDIDLETGEYFIDRAKHKVKKSGLEKYKAPEE